jgi:2'-5' RNA ligase
MTRVLAIDVALLLPVEVAETAIALSRALPPAESQGLVLGARHLPHVTLAQLFVSEHRLDAALDRVAEHARGLASLRLRVTGGTRGSSSVWMAIERSAPIGSLHDGLMRILEPFEEPRGSAAAFDGPKARPGDVAWVAGFRASASFDRFTPHITLGHARTPPAIAPFEFEATTLAVCHLGRFCTCRTVLRTSALSPAGGTRGKGRPPA